MKEIHQEKQTFSWYQILKGMYYADNYLRDLEQLLSELWLFPWASTNTKSIDFKPGKIFLASTLKA
jgi:hypothetical protein